MVLYVIVPYWMVLHYIAWYCMVQLHWYCNYDLEWLMWHWCCAEWKSEKVTCLACWIYTGTLWHKELLSELTERRLGMWVVYIHIEHCVHYVFFVLREFGALLWTILANHKKQASFEAYKIVKEKHIWYEQKSETSWISCGISVWVIQSESD